MARVKNLKNWKLKFLENSRDSNVKWLLKRNNSGEYKKCKFIIQHVIRNKPK